MISWRHEITWPYLNWLRGVANSDTEQKKIEIYVGAYTYVCVYRCIWTYNKHRYIYSCTDIIHINVTRNCRPSTYEFRIVYLRSWPYWSISNRLGQWRYFLLHWNLWSSCQIENSKIHQHSASSWHCGHNFATTDLCILFTMSRVWGISMINCQTLT